VPAKQVCQCASFERGFRMQGEVRPGDVDIISLPKFLNTPGTEVAPGSDVVGKDFQGQGLFHINTLGKGV
jgi:hypothetical protein